MSQQYRNLSPYTAPSLDGFDALFDTLQKYAPSNISDSKYEVDPIYIKKCFKIPNNKYPDCPAIMDDGRAMTDYRSACYINNLLRIKNGITNSYDYRQFLIHNGKKLINDIRLYNIEKNMCPPCDAKPINCEQVCEVDRQSVNCQLKNPCGVGTCYKAVPLKPCPYANHLSQERSKCLAGTQGSYFSKY